MDKITQKLLLIFKDRKAIIVFLFFILTGLSFPVYFASAAAWYDFLIGVFTAIPAIAVGLALLIWAVFTSLLAALAGALLSWITSGGLTSLSYTNPAGNPVIEAGLGITQGLVNMILVLVLVYIAIVTILRLEKYQTKKLLSSFILVALLVNFAPLICGVIVDATNILMNFFLRNLGGGQIIINTMKGIGDSVTTGFNYKTFLVNFGASTVKGAGFNASSASGQLEIIMGLAILGAANLVLFLVLGLFAFLFVARYIAIWILVILSPVAFAFRILPDTKKYWDMWWGQFIQWTTIGITAGFFLFLADKFASLTDAIKNANNAPGIGSSILPAAVPIAFYIIALIFSVQTAATGASAVISIAKIPAKGLGWVGKRAAGRGWKTVQDKLMLREGVKGVVSGIDRAAGSGGTKGTIAKMFRWAVPDAARKYSENRASMAEPKKRLEPESSVALMDSLASGRFTGIEAAAALAIIKERGDGEDIMQGYMRKLGIDSSAPDAYDKLFGDARFTKDKYLMRALDVLDNSGDLGKTIRNEPRLAAALAGSSLSRGKFKDKTADEVYKNYMDQTKNADISGWEKEVPMHKGVMRAFLTSKHEDAYNAVANLKGGVLTPLKTYDEIYSEWVDEKGGPGATNTSFDDFINWVEDNNGYMRGELGYRKALNNIRFKSKGWRKFQYIPSAQRGKGGQPPTPGAATTGGGGGTPPPGGPSTSAGTRPGRNPKARKRTPPPGRRKDSSSPPPTPPPAEEATPPTA